MGDMALAVTEQPAPLAEPVPHVFTVGEFDDMCEAGIFAPGVRVELVDGVVIDVPPSNPPHSGNIAAFDHVFKHRLGTRAGVRPQLSLPLSEISEPEPDLAIVRWDENFYRDRHPGPDETFAVVEVSYSSLAFDRKTKKRVYGAAGIPEYWIVDVRGERIEIHRRPHALGYNEMHVAERGDAITFVAFPDVPFTVDELLG